MMNTKLKRDEALQPTNTGKITACVDSTFAKFHVLEVPAKLLDWKCSRMLKVTAVCTVAYFALEDSPLQNGLMCASTTTAT